MFQFLIGTIKTGHGKGAPGDGSMFQFLIGTIKTDMARKRNKGKSSFNSLQVL